MRSAWKLIVVVEHDDDVSLGDVRSELGATLGELTLYPRVGEAHSIIDVVRDIDYLSEEP